MQKEKEGRKRTQCLGVYALMPEVSKAKMWDLGVLGTQSEHMGISESWWDEYKWWDIYLLN